MKKLYYLIILALISGLVLTGCLLSNVGQVPTSEQSGITYLTKSLPLTDLVGLWHFDEGSGTTANDSSGYGNDGTITGATYAGSANAMFGDALSFDGTNGYVRVGHHNEINPTSAITVECWAKLNSVNPGPVLVRKLDTYSLQVTRLEGESKLEGWVKISGNWKGVRGVSGGVIIQTNTWYHFAFTYDGTELKIYVNGQLDRFASVTGSIDFTTKPLDIGRCGPEDGSGDGWYTNGTIDEVRIWNTALTADQLNFYGFNGLLAPYKKPPRAFKIGSSIPLKWQYTDLAGIVVDSSLAIPRVRIVSTGGASPEVTGEPIIVDDPGKSGLRYDSTTDMWIFNWQTKVFAPGTYDIYITSFHTGQTNGPFEIQLKQ
jgi:hypothetical protein